MSGGETPSERELRAELRRLRAELEETVEELVTANEELQDSNEELEASQAELRRTNERLQAKLEELERTADDLSNLLSSTQIATLFLDRQFRIRWFTPSVVGLFNLLPRDLGRSIRDFAPSFRDPDLLRDAASALATLATVERDVPGAAGRWYSRRALPYRRRDGRVDGVVLTFADITERKAAEAQVRHLASHDPLTGLPNRALFLDRLGQALARARRDGGKVAVIVLDLDDFKGTNDSLGHAAGDMLLRMAAERLRARVREADTVARLGGDEFAVVQPAAQGPDAAAGLAGKLLAALAAPFAIGGHELHVGASLGVALFPGDGRDADALLKSADLALYQAKREGRGRFRFFEPAMDAAVRARRSLERELRRALERDELALVYQPQLDLRTGRIDGVEALVRWNHPERGPVPPARFIPVAEASGMIAPLGAWVLREACRQAAAWRAEGLALRVAVNLSPAQLRRPDGPAAIEEALRASGLAPGQLELEITEGVLIETFGQGAEEFLRTLAASGVRLAIDDFGTGYSSLAYLRRLPAQRIKIDRSFVRAIGADPEDEAVVRAVVNLGHDLGKEVVAEGVETAAQLAFLRDLRCDVAQGFLLGRPQPAAELGGLLAA